jgi:DNA-binding PadR family transcriptional regulator
MVGLFTAEAALLGLLSEQPMYPYQIEQQVKYRDMRFWTELSMSSIYKLLRKLEKVGFVTQTKKVSPENRLHTIYTISEKGKKQLKEKIEALLSEPEHIRWQIDVGTYNSNLLSDKKVKDSLVKYRLALEKKITGYEELLKFLQDSNCPSHRFGVATRPIFLLKGEIQWVDAFLNNLAQSQNQGGHTQ